MTRSDEKVLKLKFWDNLFSSLKEPSIGLIHNYYCFQIIMSKVNLAKLRKNWLYLPLHDCVIEGNAFVGWGKTFSNWCTTGALQRTSVTLRHLITQYMSGAVDYFYLEKNTGDYWSSEFYKVQIFWKCQKMVLMISALASKMGQIKKMKAQLYFVVW